MIFCIFAYMNKEKKYITVQIDVKLYSDIRDFCNLNNIKLKEYVNILLKKAFMEDKYGERPFDTVELKNTGHVITHNVSDTVIDTKIAEILNDPEQFKSVMEEMKSGDTEMENFVETVGGIEKYSEIVKECIFGDDAKKDNTAEQNTLPDKKIEDTSEEKEQKTDREPRKRTNISRKRVLK